jgi:uncharacterized protein involved in type VI secretion and phage assembly
MNAFDVFFDRSTREAVASHISGVVIGIVTNNQDPEELSRVKVQFPWLSDDDESHWAPVVTLVKEANQNIYEVPEVGSEVLVAFEHGDIRFPYVLGVLAPLKRS